MTDQHVCDDECATARAAYAREPFVPPAFELGAQWYSYDAGLTWTRFPPEGRSITNAHTLTVIGVDEKTGTITVAAK